MKYLQLFENFNSPQIGDYVLINIKLNQLDKLEITLKEFIDNNIGEIVGEEEHIRLLKYINIPDPIIKRNL